MFAIDLEDRPNCWGERKIISTILDAAIIDRILDQLGLLARAPPRSAARH